MGGQQERKDRHSKAELALGWGAEREGDRDSKKMLLCGLAALCWKGEFSQKLPLTSERGHPSASFLQAPLGSGDMLQPLLCPSSSLLSAQPVPAKSQGDWVWMS